MKDIETGEELFQENYIVIVNEKMENVSMSHYTFTNQIDLNREYCENYPDDLSTEQFTKENILCTYEIRDQEGNILRNLKSENKPLHQYPFFIPKEGPGFKKTLEYFLNKEKIMIN